MNEEFLTEACEFATIITRETAHVTGAGQNRGELIKECWLMIIRCE